MRLRLSFQIRHFSSFCIGLTCRLCYSTLSLAPLAMFSGFFLRTASQDLFLSFHDLQSPPFIIRVGVLLFLTFDRCALLLVPRSRRVRYRMLGIFVLTPVLAEAVRVFNIQGHRVSAIEDSSAHNRLTPGPWTLPYSFCLYSSSFQLHLFNFSMPKQSQ